MKTKIIAFIVGWAMTIWISTFAFTDAWTNINLYFERKTIISDMSTLKSDNDRLRVSKDKIQSELDTKQIDMNIVVEQITANKSKWNQLKWKLDIIDRLAPKQGK